jgi:hypothetical protein
LLNSQRSFAIVSELSVVLAEVDLDELTERRRLSQPLLLANSLKCALKRLLCGESGREPAALYTRGTTAAGPVPIGPRGPSAAGRFQREDLPALCHLSALLCSLGPGDSTGLVSPRDANERSCNKESSRGERWVRPPDRRPAPVVALVAKPGARPASVIVQLWFEQRCANLMGGAPAGLWI